MPQYSHVPVWPVAAVASRSICPLVLPENRPPGRYAVASAPARSENAAEPPCEPNALSRTKTPTTAAPKIVTGPPSAAAPPAINGHGSVVQSGHSPNGSLKLTGSPPAKPYRL